MPDGDVASVTDFRLRSIEDAVKEMRAQAAASTAAVELRLSAIQSEIKGFQLMMPDHFMPRREAEAKSEEFGTRLKSLEDRAWSIVLAVLVGLISLGISTFTWVTRNV